ncbi:MAG: phosphate/phosphite/phosphonate ABC transporter substrate-binding protein [Kiloniellales bacterium]
MRVASMPMYDMPEVRPALDSLWSGLARYLEREGIADVPGRLTHDRALADLWGDPDLLFSQCCGFDLVNRYDGRLQPIAVPHYDALGCRGVDYCSVVVVAEHSEADDVLQMRGAVCAVNGPESHSGMGALRALVAPASHEGRFFSEVKVSGSHAASLEMVRRGEADVTAIDSVTYALLARHRRAAVADTRRLGRTYRAPAVPYVTSADAEPQMVARMRTALFRAFADPNLAAARHVLFLKDVEELPVSAYGRIAEMQDFAARHGYPELR